MSSHGACAATPAECTPGYFTEVPEKSLYDLFVYDFANEQIPTRASALNQVTSYGKILRKSIQVPTYFGETTSPDFMHVLKAAEGKLPLNVIVETNDVDSKADLRETKQQRIKATREAFPSVSDENDSVHLAPKLKRYDIVTMVKKVVAQWHQ